MRVVFETLAIWTVLFWTIVPLGSYAVYRFLYWLRRRR